MPSAQSGILYRNTRDPNLDTLDSDPYSNTQQQIIKLSILSFQLHQLIAMAGVSSDSHSTKELAEGWEDVESELSICPEPDYDQRIDLAFNVWKQGQNQPKPPSA